MGKTVYWLAVLVSLSVSVGCNIQSDRAGVSNPVSAPTPIESPETENQPPEQPKATTKTETIRVEGEPMEISLQLFDSQGFPFTTYYPEKDFVTLLASSDEGAGVWFYGAKPDGTREESVYVHVFFPPEAITVEQMQQDILGENGLLASNQWELVEQSEEVPYEWATERISFRGKSDLGLIVGNVFVGGDPGRAFRVTVHFPVEYLDGFSPRTSLILENLELR